MATWTRDTLAIDTPKAGSAPCVTNDQVIRASNQSHTDHDKNCDDDRVHGAA
jgi:hypothetical protein